MNRITPFLIFITIHVLSAGSIDAEDYSNADAVYKNVKHEFILNEDGSSVYNYSHELKLLTGYAFSRAYGESFITYNPQWQELKILRSETTMRNGQKVSSPANAFNEVLPRAAYNATPYLHLREMVVTHTGLENDAVIDFAYSLNTKSGYLPGLNGKVVIADRSPIENLEIKVILPEGKNLTWLMTGSKVEPIKTNQSGKDIYTWTFRNIDLIPVEPGQPAISDISPVIYFGTENKLKLKEHIFSDTKLYFLSDDAKVIVNNITSNALSDEEKIKVIRDYIINNIGDAHIDFFHQGFKPLNAMQTFERNVGSGIDKSVLMAAMIKEAIPNRIILPMLVSRDKSSNPMKILSRFDACILYDNHNSVIIDPGHNGESYPPVPVNPVAYLAAPNITQSGILPTIAKSPGIHVRIKAELDTSMNISGRGSVTLDPFEGYSIYDESVNKYIENLFRESACKIEFTPSDIPVSGNRIVRNINLSSESPVVEKDGMFDIVLASISKNGSASQLHLGNSDRATPFELPLIKIEKWEIEFNMPENFKVMNNIENLDLEKAGTKLSSTINIDSNKVQIIKSIDLPTENISAKDYKDFSELIAEWKSKRMNMLLIKKIIN